MAEMRPIPRFPNYYADTDGNIWSNKPIGRAKVNKSGMRKLSPQKNNKGYDVINLGRRDRSLLVSRLILLTFIGPCPPHMESCHGPVGTSDNSLVNLSWGTKSKNLGEDKRRDGTAPIGMNNPYAKLTEEQVLKIRKLKNKCTQIEIAKMFNISHNHVSNIQSRHRWNHI